MGTTSAERLLGFYVILSFLFLAIVIMTGLPQHPFVVALFVLMPVFVLIGAKLEVAENTVARKGTDSD
jgi:hypothetical protein